MNDVKTTVRVWAVVLAMLAASLPAAAQPLQEFYIPLPEEEILAAHQVLVPGLTDTNIRTVIAITAAANNTTIVLDHWEDGYEADVLNPVQPTTQTWTGVTAGTVITLANTIPSSPRVPANIFPDGRDKIATTQLVAVTQAGWPLPSVDTNIAGAIEVLSTNDWGLNYIAPGGEDDTLMFEDARFIVMAQAPGTIVRVDIDNDGTDDIVQTLNEGEFVRADGIQVGAQVRSNLPVQTNFMTGDIGANYEARWYSMVPRSRWSSEYFAPVGTAVVGDEAVVILYNPYTTDLDIDVTTRTTTSVVTVPAGGLQRYTMPLDEGARFESQDGRDYVAIAAIDDESNIHDWGYTLLPTTSLASAVKVGWAPGSDDIANQNSNPIWVTAEQDTTLLIDYDDDGTDDTTRVVAAFESVKIFDPDGDQTGMRIRTDNDVLISAAYGQDPSTATTASPALDLGTTVLPIPDIYILKNSTLGDDVNSNGVLDPGDSLIYSLFVLNTSENPASNVTIIDTPDPLTTYVPGTTSTVLLGPVSDDVAPATPFPIDEVGLNLGTLLPNQSDTIFYERRVGDPLPSPAQQLVNTAQVTIDLSSTTVSSTDVALVQPPEFTVTKTSDVVGSAVPGDTIEYTVTVLNSSAITQTDVTVTDPLPAGVTYDSESTLATGPGGAGGPANYRDDFNPPAVDGTDGSVDWSGTPWVELGESNGIAAGRARILDNGQCPTGSGAGTPCMRISNQNSIDGRGWSRALTIPAGATNTTLSYVYRRRWINGTPGSSVTIETSTDGGTNWTVQRTYVLDGTDGAAGVAENYTIPDNTNAIRVIGNGTVSGRRQFLIDNIDITYTGPGNSLDNDPNTGTPALDDGDPSFLVTAADGFDLDPGETLTVTYRVIVNDPLNPFLPAITNVATGGQRRESDALRWPRGSTRWLRAR